MNTTEKDMTRAVRRDQQQRHKRPRKITFAKAANLDLSRKAPYKRPAPGTLDLTKED